MLMMVIVRLQGGTPIGPLTNPIVRWLGLMFLGGWCMTAALRAASSVARERERQTLDTLLMLPGSRAEILKAKSRSCGSWGKDCRNALFLLSILGVVSRGLEPFALPLVVVFAFVMQRFATALGLWLSIVCRNTLRATVWLVVLLIVLSVWPYLLAEVASAIIRYQSGIEEAKYVETLVSGLSPFSCWQTLTFYWKDFATEGKADALRFIAALISTTSLFGCSGILWWDSRRRFEKEGN